MSAGGYAAKEQTCAWEEVTSPLAPFVLTRVHDWLSRLCAAMASAEALRSTLPQMSQTAAMYGPGRGLAAARWQEGAPQKSILLKGCAANWTWSTVQLLQVPRSSHPSLGLSVFFLSFLPRGAERRGRTSSEAHRVGDSYHRPATHVSLLAASVSVPVVVRDCW